MLQASAAVFLKALGILGVCPQTLVHLYPTHIHSQEGFSKELAPTPLLSMAPQRPHDKARSSLPGIQGSTHSVPLSLLFRDSNPSTVPPNSKNHHFASPHPLLPLCRSHPAAVGNALPPPWPGKGSHEGSGVGVEAVSWSGKRGLWPSPASAGPLPSFPGSSLGPEPHILWLALVRPPWLQPLCLIYMLHPLLPASLQGRITFHHFPTD